MSDRRGVETTVDRRGASVARMPHHLGLDGLRGLAVVAVVGFHFAPKAVPGGFLGVDVFFVLSGFLITSLLVSEHERTGRIALVAFWVRRARRLLPALLLVLVAVGLYAAFESSQFEASRIRSDGIAALGYFANWHFIWSGQSYIADFAGLAPSPLRHTWSLAIEEQFYLVWPVAVAGLSILCTRRAIGLRRALVVGSIVLGAVSVVAMALIFRAGDDPSRVYYGTDTRAHLLLAGGALGALTGGTVQLGTRTGRRAMNWIGAVSAVVLTGLIFSVGDTSAWLYEGGYALIALLVVMIVATSAQPGTSILARVFGNSSLVWVGTISYGIYLWHWPVLLAVDADTLGVDGVLLFVVRVALTLVLAIASFHLVEQPIRSGVLRRLGPVVPRIVTPVAVVVTAGILIGQHLVVRAPSAAAIRNPDRAASVTRAYERVATCGPGLAPKREHAEVLLIGNSIADEIDECVAQILAASGIRLRSDARTGEALCDALPRLTRQAKENTAEAVVIYALEAGYSICWTRNGTEEPAVTDTWVEDVRAVIDLYLPSGATVFLVPPPPDAGATEPDPLTGRFEEIASEHPGRVRVLDVHEFVRDPAGRYRMWMPCVSRGEPGCRSGVVQVRLALDGGSHLCTAADHGDFREGCDPEDAAGVRRVAAAFSAELISAFDTFLTVGEQRS